MANGPSNSLLTEPPTDDSGGSLPWHTFAEIVNRLHQEHIYIHPHQLAEFFLRHGLPVELRYVPAHLRQRAMVINANYQGDLARLEPVSEPAQLFSFE